MKKENKNKIIDRLNAELGNLYHNATPDYSIGVPDALLNEYEEEFNFWAECEIDFIKTDLELMTKNGSKVAAKITDYGKIYTWGRGGRTLAPEKLINQRGGSSFSIKQYDYDDISISDALELMEVLEAFNAYIKDWNSKQNLQYMWKSSCENRKSEIQNEAQNYRLEVKKLAKECRNLVAGESVCNVLKREINRLREHHKELIQKIQLYNSAIKE